MTKIPFSRAAHAISFSSQNSNSKLMSRRIQNSGEERDVRGMNISFPYLQLHCTAPACIQRGYGEIARCLYAVLAVAHGSFEIARHVVTHPPTQFHLLQIHPKLPTSQRSPLFSARSAPPSPCSRPAALNRPRTPSSAAGIAQRHLLSAESAAAAAIVDAPGPGRRDSGVRCGS